MDEYDQALLVAFAERFFESLYRRYPYADLLDVMTGIEWGEFFANALSVADITWMVKHPTFLKDTFMYAAKFSQLRAMLSRWERQAVEQPSLSTSAPSMEKAHYCSPMECIGGCLIAGNGCY